MEATTTAEAVAEVATVEEVMVVVAAAEDMVVVMTTGVEDVVEDTAAQVVEVVRRCTVLFRSSRCWCLMIDLLRKHRLQRGIRRSRRRRGI